MSNIQDLMKNIENDTKILNDVITKPDGTYVNLPDGSSIPSVRTWRSELVNTALDATNYPLRSEMNGIIDNRLINGGMTKVFYVDAVNGNDDNSGDQASPFKTIKKAVDSSPNGSFVFIYLANNAEHIIDNFIYPTNKVLYFSTNDITNTEDEALIKQNSANKDNTQMTYGFRSKDATFIFNNVSFETPIYDSTIYQGKGIWHGIMSRFDGGSYTALFISCNFVLNDFPFARFPSGAHGAGNFKFYDCSFTKNSDAPLIYLDSHTSDISFNGTVSLVDGSGNAIAYSDLISGVIKDTNGVPRNIVSNIVF